MSNKQKIMSNKQKAREIAEYLNQPNGSNSLLQCHQAAMAMAEWKDKQFKKEKERWIEKSAIWIMNHISDYFGCPPVYPRTMIDDYKKAMKEE